MPTRDTAPSVPGVGCRHERDDASPRFPDPVPFDRIHALWDDLADHDTTHSEDALMCLLHGLCTLLDAHNASWIGAVRMEGSHADDPVNGWRPRIIRRLRSDATQLSGLQQQVRRLEQGSADPSAIRNASQAGRFRVHLLKELVPEAWFQSELYRALYLDRGYADAIWAGVPINADAECYFGVFRATDRPSFGSAECTLMAHVLHGLRWFMRQQMLSHGLVVASSPLTATERNVLQGLLAGLTEKQIAASLGQAFNTTHSHVKRLFHKFGVRNRAALMAMWLGSPTPD